ncbi:MAG: hypothetical protein GAK31_02415 [Stenotrophomonas maltophilia]|uniref:Uracil-DNA glycosylase-like domain-containing protein n=1 Tax=Stenotrophomonas maltophilia TaxID=40324 RepID=A0A7V8JLA2_STEMA|nr:MAG: hypothetical protein GAK31_02415 [Stenotrophomonas maltophilia]
MHCQGFPAQVNDPCTVLVLGSMPGIASLQAGQYYAHPRNRFWPLMGLLCGFDAALPYEQRLRALQASGGGLWDVIGQCRRRGSLDAHIERGSEVPNALPALLARLPRLQLVACNGAAAFQAWQRFIAPDLAKSPPVLSLPSTSPANAAWSLPRLRTAWAPAATALAAHG